MLILHFTTSKIDAIWATSLLLLFTSVGRYTMSYTQLNWILWRVTVGCLNGAPWLPIRFRYCRRQSANQDTNQGHTLGEYSPRCKNCAGSQSRCPLKVGANATGHKCFHEPVEYHLKMVLLKKPWLQHGIRLVHRTIEWQSFKSQMGKPFSVEFLYFVV